MTKIVTAIAEYTGSVTPLQVPAWLPRLIVPYMTRTTTITMPLSNAKARAELDWRPQYSTVRDGLAHMFRQAA